MNARAGFAAVLFLLAHGPLFAAEQGYPSRPIRLIVPFPPGGTIDIVGRIVAQGLSERVGKTVVVDNRAGAGGVIGAELVARSAPDGYTLCLCSPGAMITSPMLLAKPPYDARRDFAPVTAVASVPYLLLARPGGIGSVKELVALARQKPGTLNYGSAGTGATSHLAGALFVDMARIDVVHVPYKGSAQAATELIGGRIHFVFEAMGAAAQYVKTARLRPLGISTLKRSSSLPDVPTISEAGVPGYEMSTWHSVCVARATPKAIISTLHREIAAAISEPANRDRLTGLGADVLGGTPGELQELINRETLRWDKLLTQLGLKEK